MGNAPTMEAYLTTSHAVREQRILESLPLVKRIAGAYAARVPNTVDAADLVSAGTLGLIRAVDEFDGERGVPFELFTSRRIRIAILDHLRSLDPLPYSTRVKLRRIESCMVVLQGSLKRMPTEGEIAEAAGFTPEQVSDLMAQASSLPLFSLDEGQDADSGADPPAEDPAADALSSIERLEMKEILAHRIRELPRTERLVLSLYYYEGLKMKEIGNFLGITESRVSQIHARAVTMLRAHVRELQEQRE
jgi:RNA polymerase sigma factor for flagellar operon FliA